ncbi:hypothetical protein SKAU_G00082900 [Synaphobranchus kaupii]|uniref:Uncharacterized protein n=1 Tax=Synaphobranchus kaupii TaxID=118154 RepID=A0A9Q1FV98_SYNKA|nr:hypothetical protein SKAU_G00082900 [Synaphobranchus kaupii]
MPLSFHSVELLLIEDYKPYPTLLQRSGDSMSRIPMLLRNVIRHTDAHNKIQEESEMWKLRGMEKQVPGDQVMPHGRKPAHMPRGHMHCDRFLEETSASTRDREDEREARYATRKLYDFEASDPNRWGHSGFKELYPEEFGIDGEKECRDGDNLQLRKRRCKAALGSERHKRSKKSSHKKKKKKEKKRRKEDEEEQGGQGRRSSSSSESRDGDRRRPRRKSGKSKHRRKKRERERERREESRSGDSASEGSGGRRARRPRKRRRKAGSDGGCRAPDEPHRKKRKDWKAPNEQNSEESSED